MKIQRWTWFSVIAALALAACGGSGSSDPGGGGGATDLSISATGPATAIPGGGASQVDVTISNGGTQAQTGVVTTTRLGSGLVQGAVTCAGSGGATCPTTLGSTISVGTLPAQSSLTFHIAVAVASGASGPITSTASVTSNSQSATQKTATFTINAYSADVSVAGSVPNPLVIGGVANYTMTVVNAGPDAARDVALATTVDAGQTLGAMTCASSGGALCPSAPGLSMTVPSLPKGGSLTFTIPAAVPPGASGIFTSVMAATVAGDPQASNNAATATVSTTPLDLIRLQSDFGDYIGAGASYSYSRSNAQITVSANAGHLAIRIDGDENWSADFQLPSAFAQFQPGTYNNLTRWPFNDPATGGLDWSGEGRGCNMLQGSFSVSSATYVNASLVAIDLSFEQHCEGAVAALRGQIHWTAADNSLPPGPVNPPPSNLWTPPAGSTPSTGNYVYLQSDFGDYIGGGANYTYTLANAILRVNGSGGHVAVAVTGNESWNGDFQAMNGLAELQPGYYSNLQRYPFHNPTKGGLDWYGEGRGCNRLQGWFVIDSISFANGNLSSIDLRFEQHCEGGFPALHGKIHWAPNDTTAPPGPVNPPPAGLWMPPAGATPATGNYIFLQSDAGDYIGQGQTYTYTPANATAVLTTVGARLSVSVSGWNADFQAMLGLAQLQPGYYGNLHRFPFHNPVAGGLNWSGQGRGCNTLQGWFVVDSVSYQSDSLKSIDLRFEQHCEGMTPALHGQIHWIQ